MDTHGSVKVQRGGERFMEIVGEGKRMTAIEEVLRELGKCDKVKGTLSNVGVNEHIDRRLSRLVTTARIVPSWYILLNCVTASTIQVVNMKML
jgi:hypothetical protein